MLKVVANCTNKNHFPHAKFKWRTENTSKTLHFPVLGNTCMIYLWAAKYMLLEHLDEGYYRYRGISNIY